jgi:formylglycine-generating enzyme required for sulfatase activity
VGGNDELPIHAVYLDAFEMDVYKVTNRKYADGLNWALSQGDLIEVTNGRVHKHGDTSTRYCDTTNSSSHSRILWNGDSFGVLVGKEEHPMTMVAWYGAAAYSNWRSEMEGRTPSYDTTTWDCNFAGDGYRLPTEAEWEYAARGGENDPYYNYPWGDAIDGSKANYASSGDPYESGTIPYTTPVGYYDGNQTPAGSDMANGYGLYDTVGVAWEWCNDWYASNYYEVSPYDNPRGPESGTGRVLRSGGYGSPVSYLRCAERRENPPNGSSDHTRGFRLVLD